MAKWEALLASLKQKSYTEASTRLNVIQDNDDLQDALQVIPFKTLNTDLPESLSFLEKLYTKFITLINDKEEGRLIIRHVFKVEGFLANVIRTQVRDGVLGRTTGPSLDSEVVDHITQITWNMDSAVIKEFMVRLTRLKATVKYFQTNFPMSTDVKFNGADEVPSELSKCLVEFNAVIEHLQGLTEKRTGESSESLSWSKLECGSCRSVIEEVKKRAFFNRTVLDVLEPCEENMERCSVLFQNLKDLVVNDQKFLEVMTELSVDISCYGNVRIEEVVQQYISSYKTLLSSVASVNEPSLKCQRSNSLENNGSDRNVVDHGLRIEVNGSPFRRNIDARRLRPVRDKRERKEPTRSSSCREPRQGETLQLTQFPTTDNQEGEKLKGMLDLKEKQLEETRTLVKTLRKREEQLIQKLTVQAKINLMSSEKFENVSQDAPRVDGLVRQYDDLYSQLRLDALDDLDNMSSFENLDGSDEIKAQITFAVITVSFQLAKHEIENRLKTVYTLLNISTKNDDCKSVRNEISLQLRKSAFVVDLTHVVEEVCNGLCKTMFDFPELKSCGQLRSFVEACVRFSWSISAHVPPLTVEYEPTKYTASLHNKSHNSDKDSDVIKYYVWPALVESHNKTVLYKGIVVT